MHSVTTGFNKRKIIKWKYVRVLCLIYWFIYIYLFVPTTSELIKAVGGRVRSTLLHIANYKKPAFHESITARWLWTPVEKITWCSVGRLSLEVARRQWRGKKEKRACNALIGGLFWKRCIRQTTRWLRLPRGRPPPTTPRAKWTTTGVGQPLKLNESLDCIFSQHWFPGCAHDHNSMSGPLIKYQHRRRLSPDCHWYHWELLLDRLAHFIPKEEVKRAAWPLPLCSVCWCDVVWKWAAALLRHPAPAHLFPFSPRSAHLPSIWSSTSTVFKVWSSCCLPSCTALLLTATLENDIELQFGSKCSRDVSLLRFLTYTLTLHSTPVSPSSVFQSWSHNQSCIDKFHPQNLSVAFRKKN